MSMSDQSHSRRNPLTDEWVLVSPHRLLRPWQGLVEGIESDQLPTYDSGCYLCPGNERANGNRNPDYKGTFVFDNDFPALSVESTVETHPHPLFETRAEIGCCRVICYTERHDLRLATMNDAQRSIAVQAMISAFSELDQRADIAYVQVFENRGEMMGCSNPHPHAQVWATSNVPTEPAKELKAQSEYFSAHGTSLLLDYAAAEIQDGSRVVVNDEHSLAVVPYWAVWPFETLLIPRRAVAAPDELDGEEIDSLANSLGAVLRSYEGLFAASVPYSLGFHARPSNGQPHPEWQLHIHIYPPLLRSATIRKHIVGFEMLGQPQRDLTPEVAAEKLRTAHRQGSEQGNE